MAATPEPLRIGEWLVDPRDDSLTRGSERVKIEPRTMRLLMRLAQEPGSVVSQDELLESVWSGVVVSPASIYQSMSQLRKVLGDGEDPPRYIETVARKGYRLIATVAPASPATPALPAPAAATIAPDTASEAADAPRKTRQIGWIAIAVLAGVAVMAAVWRFAPLPKPQPEAVSIAVLPFTDMTAGKSEQAFCDGLTEETSNWLAQIPTLRVVARTSAFSYRDRGADVREIGRELNISHVLEGSLRRSGDRMRITVQLIDTRSGYHLWSGSYDVEAGDVLSVQEEVARAVAGNLELRMTPEIRDRFDSRRSANAEAQRLYLIARSHAAKLDAPSNAQAITLYRQAIEADPEFALAKVWLARSLANQRYFTSRPIEELAPEIETLLDEAEKTAPDLADVYVVRGGFLVAMRRRDEAMRNMRRALELNPNSVTAANALGYYYLTAAQPRDALTYYTVASTLDPRDYGAHAYRCQALTDLGQFTVAEVACERARSLEPESPYVYSVSSAMEAARGDFVAAMKWSESALQRGSDIGEVQGARARWLVALGMLPEAGKAWQSAFETDAAGTRRNTGLTFVGAAAAIDAGGGAALRSFVERNGLAETDDPSMMFELASAFLMVGDAQSARAQVDRALASRRLHPEDLASPWMAREGWSYLLVAAAALRATGDGAGAERRLDELTALLDHLTTAGVQTSGLSLLEAQVAAMRGQGDAAMHALNLAVERGWNEAWLAEHQPYFESLRSRADYQALLAAVRARNARTAAEIAPRLSGLLGREARGAATRTGAVIRLHHQVDGGGELVAAEHRREILLGGGVAVFARNVRAVVGPAGARGGLDEPVHG
ncbi:MAG TPA: winged helix-turn-helix domain-containing protein [Steroidobacteraceae bacterium]|nr:winged helix-turn-helix domain-containing protein [Steroidobacteraceae bacterium]